MSLFPGTSVTGGKPEVGVSLNSVASRIVGVNRSPTPIMAVTSEKLGEGMSVSWLVFKVCLVSYGTMVYLTSSTALV